MDTTTSLTNTDGEETVVGVDGFITNPLFSDTDGDGIPDAVEITVNSDPTDPASSNYAEALVNITVTPAGAILYYNTIDTETSQQLTVLGNLIDGSQINLTSLTRGTNYASSDLSIISFGGEAGQIFTGQDGKATVTITNNGHTTTAEFTVLTFTPSVRSFLELPGDARSIRVRDDIAYVPAGLDGLMIVDVSDPDSPYLISTIMTGGNSRDVQINGDIAFVANETGLVVLDISNPEAAEIISTLSTPGQAQDVAVTFDNKLLVADGASGFQIVDVSDVLSPQLLSTIDTFAAVAVDVDGDTAVGVCQRSCRVH